MEGHERQKKMEAGREKLRAYSQQKHGKTNDDLFSNETRRGQEPVRKKSSATPSSSSYTTAEEGFLTPSSCASEYRISTSGEEVLSAVSPTMVELQKRVKLLEEKLADKNAALSALNEELAAARDASIVDASVGPLTLSIESEYRNRLQEFSTQIAHRDEIIEKLTISLKESVDEREKLEKQAAQLAGEMQFLQTQLRTANQHIQQPQQILSEALKEKEAELHQKSEELKQCKMQSAKEVQELMSSLEKLQRSSSAELTVRHAKLEERLRKQTSNIENGLKEQYENDRHHFEEKLLAAHEAEQNLGSQLNAVRAECDKLKLDLTAAQLSHGAEISLYKDQLQCLNSAVSSSEEEMKVEVTKLQKHVECLEEKLQEETSRAASLEETTQSLQCRLSEEMEEKNRHKTELNMLEKQLQDYASDMSRCRQTIEQYKNQLENAQRKFAEELSEIEGSHCAELALYKEQIIGLQKNEAELGTVKSELGTVKANLKKKSEDARFWEQQVVTLQQQLGGEQQWVVAYKEQIQALNQQLKDEKELHTACQQKKELLSQHLREEQASCSECKQQLVILQQQLTEEQHQVKLLTQQLSDEKQWVSSHKQQIEVLNAQLKQEHSLSETYQSQIEVLQEQVKNELLRNDSFKERIESLTSQLNEEKILIASYKQQVDELNKHQNETKERYSEERFVRKEHIQAESHPGSQDENVLNTSAAVEKHEVELLDVDSECSQKSHNMGEPFEVYKREADELRVKLSALSETNAVLETKKTETEHCLKETTEQLAQCKESFENTVMTLKAELVAKEESLSVLQRERDTLCSQKKQIHEFNQQVKNLLSDKQSLEDDLINNQKMYEKELLLHKERIDMLENQVGMKGVQSDIHTLQAIVSKCRLSIDALQQFYESKVVSSQDLSENQPSPTHLPSFDGDGCRLSVGDDSGGKCTFHQKTITELLNVNNSLKAQLKANRIAGIETLQQLLNVSVEMSAMCSEKSDGACDIKDKLSQKVFDSSILVEKLKQQLEDATEECLNYKSKYEELHMQYLKIADITKQQSIERNKENQELEDCISELKILTDISNECKSPQQPDVTPNASSIVPWVQRCDSLEQENSELKSKLQNLQTKLEEVDIHVDFSPNISALEKSLHQVLDKMNCQPDFVSTFNKEWQNFQSIMQNTRKEINEKHMTENTVENILKKYSSTYQNENIPHSNVKTLMLDLGLKSVEVVFMQNELEAQEQALHVTQKQLELQSLELKKATALLEEMLQASINKESALLTTQNELEVSNRRLKRLESVRGTVCHRAHWSQKELCFIAEELEAKMESYQSPMEERTTENPPHKIVEKLDAAIKIGKKMFSERESAFIKLQKEQIDFKSVIASLQSDALNLRRLVASLEETLQAVLIRSSPVLKLHLDLLQKELDRKQELYQEACEVQYSLEAELREHETKAQQQEELLMEEIKKLRLSAKYWQIQSESILLTNKIQELNQTSPLQEWHNLHAEIKAAHASSLSQLGNAINRMWSMQESEVQSEKTNTEVVNTELKQKEMSDALLNEQCSTSTVDNLVVSPNQELSAAQGECELKCLKEIYSLYQEMSLTSMTTMKQTSDTGKNFALELLKHQIAKEYMSAVKDSALASLSEWQQHIKTLEAQLRECSEGSLIVAPIDEVQFNSVLDGMEQLLPEIKHASEQLIKVCSSELHNILATIEHEHNYVFEQVQLMKENVKATALIEELKTEISCLQDKHRAALENMQLSHSTEVSQQLAEAQSEKEAALTSLCRELEEKHKRQMEELRTYFEQKCADFEKHYSEEVFSQHSRKMSDCSSASESELVSEMYYTGPGPAPIVGPVGELQRLSQLRHICDSFGESSFKDLEEPIRPDFEKLFVEKGEQLEAVRLAIESRYQAELEAQREEYETRVEEIVHVMNENHQTELNLQIRQLQDLQDGESVLTNRLSELENEILKLKSELNTMQKKNKEAENETSELKKQLLEAQRECSLTLEQEVPAVRTAAQSQFSEYVESREATEVPKLSEEVNSVTKMDVEQEEALKAELDRLAATLKRTESESSAQIATLKTKLRQNHELMSKYEKELTNLKVQHEKELKDLRSSLEEKCRQDVEEVLVKLKKVEQELPAIKEVEIEQRIREKVKSELDAENQKRWTQLRSKLEEKDSDRWVSELRTQLQLQQEVQLREKDAQCEQKISELRESQEALLKEKKCQLEAEYAEYLEYVKKSADDHKQELIQCHQHELAELRSVHERELARLRDGNEECGRRSGEAVQGSTLEDLLRDRESLKDSSFSAEHMSELQKISEELEVNHQAQLEALEASLVRIHKEAISQLQQQASLKEEELRREHEAQVQAVQQECERRFQVQLEEAREDIVFALAHHVQALLEDEDCDRPQELQQLEQKLFSKYEHKLHELKEEHQVQLTQLRDKHASEIRKLTTSDLGTAHITKEEFDRLEKERDCLRNVAATLRDVVAELVRYFISCEDELNNTLMDELIRLEGERNNDLLCKTPKQSIHDSVTALDTTPMHQNDVPTQDHSNSSEESSEKMSLVVATPARGCPSSALNVRRVHFAPDISSIMTFIDEESLLECVGVNTSSRDVSLNFHEELERCLVRLRHESAALLVLSKVNSSITLPASSHEHSPLNTQDEVARLQAQLTEVQESKQQLSLRFASARHSAKQLEQDNEKLQEKLDAMQGEQEALLAELCSMRQRLECTDSEARRQVEVVTEGYGEGNQSMNSNEFPSSPRATTLEQLQDKARSLFLGTGNSNPVSGIVSPNTSHQLVDELCRDWEFLAEEAKHKQDDLQLQSDIDPSLPEHRVCCVKVEVADKQLKATRAFLDEQATEREQERDEFVREIKRLQELLHDKDRDQSSQQHTNNEVEDLDNQLKEVQSTLLETQKKMEQLEVERNNAVEKIWILRDIISDLEGQIAAKAQEAEVMQEQNEALKGMVEQQGRTHLELAQEMEALQFGPGNTKLSGYINQLEDELKKNQLQIEQFANPVVMRQMKSQLRDLETSLQFQTKELENAHASVAPGSPCLSSPSEDVSIRETLEVMRAATGQSADRPISPITLPLDEVARLHEQLQRHSRADDAALKRMRDLDMQLEDVQAERNALTARLQEQLLQVSSLKAKLDEQRRKADARNAQASAEVCSQLQDLQSEMDILRETLDNRDRQINTLETALSEAQMELKRQEAKVRDSIEAEQNIAANLQRQVVKLSADKEKLKAMVSAQNDSHVTLPVLVESMLADKNADIDRLEKQVLQLTQQVEMSSEYVATPSTTLEFEYREPEKMRCHVELAPVLELRHSFNDMSDKVVTQREDETLQSLPRSDTIIMEPIYSESVVELGIKPSLPGDISARTQEPFPLSMIESQNTSERLDESHTEGKSLVECEKRLVEAENRLQEKSKLLEEYENRLMEHEKLKSILEEKSKQLGECEMRLAEMSSLEAALKTVREELKTTIAGVNIDKECLEAQLHAKDVENQRLSDEVRSLQAILTNLRTKLQEAKQAARSPSSRNSTDDKQAIQVALNAAQAEIAQLQEKCLTIKMEVVDEYSKRQTELEELLRSEQQTLQAVISELQEERNKGKYQDHITELEQQLKEAHNVIKDKDLSYETLQAEMAQINMECLTLKSQISVPVNESLNLTSKLDAEKMFAEALKEELGLCKARVLELEEEISVLKRDMESTESLFSENRANSLLSKNQHLEEKVAELSRKLEKVQAEKNSESKNSKQLLQEIAMWKEENLEVGKELTDMKRLLNKKHTEENSQRELEQKITEQEAAAEQAKKQIDSLEKQLFALRKAFEHIDSSQTTHTGLSETDIYVLNKLRNRLQRASAQGAGDGPRQRLSASEIDVFEIGPSDSQLGESESLDDLTGLVQHELDVSFQLDDTLLQTLEPLGKNGKNSTTPFSSQPTATLRPAASSSASKGRKHSGDLSHNSQFQAQTQNTSKLLVEQNKRMQLLECELSQEREQVIQLKNELSKAQAAVQLLENQLQEEHVRYDSLQQQDCELIEIMRVKLERTLDMESKLRLQLEQSWRKAAPTSDALDQRESKEAHSLSIRSPPILNDGLEEQNAKLCAVLQQELEREKSERDALEKKLRRLQEVEVRRSRRRAANEEQHRRRIDQLQALLHETQQESATIKQKMSSVNQELHLVRQELASERDAHIREQGPFLQRLKNMNNFLEEHIQQRNRIDQHIETFTEENRQLRSRIVQLEQQLSEHQSGQAGAEANRQFATERVAWEQERSALHLALSDALQKRLRCPESELEDRVNFLFGRYQRVESYRKALIWQKRYLLVVLDSFNETRNLAVSHLAHLGRYPLTRHSATPRNTHHKFRSAVFAVVAIHRMRFMVDRWLRAKRIGSSVVLSHAYSQYAIPSIPSHQGTGLHTHASSSPVSASVEELRFRTGVSLSPPTLERPRLSRPQQAQFSIYQKQSTSSKTVTPSSLAESLANFQLQQQHFDSVLAHPPK